MLLRQGKIVPFDPRNTSAKWTSLRIVVTSLRTVRTPPGGAAVRDYFTDFARWLGALSLGTGPDVVRASNAECTRAVSHPWLTKPLILSYLVIVLLVLLPMPAPARI